MYKNSANTVRMLSVDAVQKANSGHPGMPMGMADCAVVLWSEFMNFNPQDPKWPNRDRFILSAGHGSMLIYSLLYLFGYPISLEDIKNFRQWDSCTPGHPEYGHTPGIETTTGPLGQGFTNGVGMALASKILEEKSRSEKFSPISHRIFGIVSDGDLMEGISNEAASFAGHHKLDNIIYIYDDNSITIDGKTNLTFSDNIPAKFEAIGWHTISIDGHNYEEIAKAIQEGIDYQGKPTLIAAKTHIAFGSPNKQDSASSHGAPLGEDEVKLTKDKQWRKDNPKLAEHWDIIHQQELPPDLEEKLKAVIPEEADATRKINSKVVNKIGDMLPWVYGGSADLEASIKVHLNEEGSIGPATFSGRNIHFGIREHAMGSILNGMALYGGFVPFGSTFLVFSDYMHPSLRLAALMGIQVIFIFTHDSVFVGEDGPTHQPVEQVSILRSIPNLTVFRPADGEECLAAWLHALSNKKGPTAMCLTRQKIDKFAKKDHNIDNIKKGAYIVSEENSNSALDLVIMASGSEVPVALKAKQILSEKNMNIRVVSLPSLDLFIKQSLSYRSSIIPEKDIPIVMVEAGLPPVWQFVIKNPFLFYGIDHFGASAPGGEIAEKFGFTGEKLASRIMEWKKTI
ncbi:MAG: transketolase [bacterium]